jgi:foldase protein PrsA
MKRKNRWRKLLAAVTGAFLMFTGGCSQELPGEEEPPAPQTYTWSQIMVIAVTERNRYEQVYTDRIWDAVMEGGETFEEYLLDQVRIFMENMKTMTLLAEDQGIVLSTGEQDRVRRLARNYYSELSRTEIEYMGISEEDVAVLYQDYYTANKVVEKLTEGLDLEVSDSEAKVITIREMRLKDRASADLAYGKLQEEGSDFSAVAREVTGASPQERRIGRGEVPEALEEAAFGLASGQVSQVVELEDGFCLIQCVNDYEMDATRERKAQIYKERKNWAFQQIYSQFQSEHKVPIPEEIWAEVTFQGGEDVETADFFSLYEKEFGTQGY